jgi:RNA polymerase sigma-70 factor, ECF subfamily
VDKVYGELERLLFSIAYRMVGSATEAEDIVQEAFLRYHRTSTEGTAVESPKAYLSAITTRLSIDHLRLARVQRERYVGTWLPEPIVTDDEGNVERYAETADSLSLGFLVLLERLTPVERAVFLLRDAFDYGYDEIASIVGKTESNCRQIAVRARRRVHAGRPRFEASRAKRQELASRFFKAALSGDEQGLLSLLAADIVAYADGGGKGFAFPEPVHGREQVARLFAGSGRTKRLDVLTVVFTEINGQPGAIFFHPNGTAVLAASLDIAENQVQTVRAVTNPDKLRHLERLAGPAESPPNALSQT